MRIWYINHYASPPGTGGSSRSFQIGRGLSALGHDVVVIGASRHHIRHYPASKSEVYHLKSYDGVLYYHLPTRAYSGNGGKRLLNMLEFAIGILRLGMRVRKGQLKRPDILVPSCAHAFVYPTAWVLSRLFAAKIVYEIRDIWPLTLVEIAGVRPHHPLIWVMALIERFAYRTAHGVISLLPEADRHMTSRGLKSDRFHYIPNGVSPDEWKKAQKPLPDSHREIFQQLHAEKKLVVVYAGAHGPPNALEQILALRSYMPPGDTPFHFVLIGEGISKERLERQCKADHIDFVSFLPRIDKSAIPAALSQADVCFIAWQDRPIYRFGISPNKIGDYFMAGKPVLHLVNAGNDPVQEAAAGISVPPGDPAKLLEALDRFIKMKSADRKAMGERGRKYAMNRMDWSILGQKLSGIFESLASSSVSRKRKMKDDRTIHRSKEMS